MKFSFAAICDPPCSSGGACSSPGVCSCPSGFAGDRCGADVDECALGEDVHGCHGDSVCVNKHGW